MNKITIMCLVLLGTAPNIILITETLYTQYKKAQEAKKTNEEASKKWEEKWKKK